MPLRAAAPAKINLCLQVLGRRADGYHELESLVAFADVADALEVGAGDGLSLSVDGPFAADAGAADTNLAMRAARLLRETTGTARGAAMRLTKTIPVGGGFGGGSADAAAALTLLNGFWRLGLDATDLSRLGATLGADVPMCLRGVSALVRGIGDAVEPVAVPRFDAVLVHPRLPLLTRDVYAACETVAATPSLPERFPDVVDRTGWLRLLSATRNDLQIPAVALQPAIGRILEALALSEPLLARMTGSGAGCFALYANAADAASAATQLAACHPGWWVTPAVIGPAG